MQKCIAILGATGSVGRQALDVAESRSYRVDFLSANNDSEGLELLARRFSPRSVCIANHEKYADLRDRLRDTDIKVVAGEDGICDEIAISSADTVVNSILGKAGLVPTLAVIDSGKRLALANKESLVIAGDIVMKRAQERGVDILPVDSEHSAIFQSLKAGKSSEIKSIILTASGGPFFGKSPEQLKNVTLEQTLAHPTWKMGKKITVDSATLMNKGFELIEAVHLFGVSPEQVRVVIHRESILHSAVEFVDNTLIGEFSVPDMRMCVQYAVDYPDRCPSQSERLDIFKVGKLTFAEPDYEAFPLLTLAKEAVSSGGAMGAVLNASDEIAVSAFLEGRIKYCDISRVVSNTLEKLADGKKVTSLDSILEYDTMARACAEEYIGRNIL